MEEWHLACHTINLHPDTIITVQQTLCFQMLHSITDKNSTSKGLQLLYIWASFSAALGTWHISFIQFEI